MNVGHQARFTESRPLWDMHLIPLAPRNTYVQYIAYDLSHGMNIPLAIPYVRTNQSHSFLGNPSRSLPRKHRSPRCGQYAQYAKPPSRLAILSEELQIRHLPRSAKDLSEMFFRCVVRHLGGSSTWRSGRKPSPKDNMTASSPRLC